MTNGWEFGLGRRVTTIAVLETPLNMDSLSYDHQVIAELLRLLTDANPVLRREAALQLSVIKPQNEQVICALGIALNDDDWEVGRRAGIGLFCYGANCKRILPDVVKALQHSDICVRRVAAGILYMIGPDAVTAVPVLETLVTDSDQLLRGWVTQALESIAHKENQ